MSVGTKNADIGKRRLTLQDIADRVGVTKMTVSRFLRSPESVAEKTRKRIGIVVDDLGYIPSRVPDILANAASRAVGVLIPSLSNQVFSSLVRGVESVAMRAGYQLLLAHYGYSLEREEEQVASLLSYHVDGLILSGARHTKRTRKIIAAADIPVVETMDLPEDPIDMAIGLDHRAAGRAMTRAMLSRGRQRPVYLGARLDDRDRLRMEGYYDALREAGLEGRHLLTGNPSSFTLGGELLDQALLKWPDLDALFCTNDDIAAGVVLRAQAQGMPVPERLAVAGNNALDIGQILVPKLASIVIPREEMGREAANMLLARLEGRTAERPCRDVGFSLFEGGSLG